jgi:hypothetical protein
VVLGVLRNYIFEGGEPGPTRVDGLLVRVLGIVRQSCTALDAQSRTVLHTQRPERQCKHDRVPQQRLEVEQVVLEPADFVVEILIRRVVPDVVVHEQLLEPDRGHLLDGFQAPCAFADQLCRGGAGDQHALHDRLEPQVEFDRRVFGDTQDFDAKFCRRRHGAHHVPLGPRAAAELAGIEHERRSRVQAGHDVTPVRTLNRTTKA